LTVYVDSSFLLSSYFADAHSVHADQRMAGAPAVFLTRAELAVAIFQQVFLKRAPLAAAQQSWKDFESDCRNGVWNIVEFPQRAWETNTSLARRYGPTLGVRTLDSLHVACALELKAERFWTFDERQARLAEAVGLNTNP
jgi:predicted nucleic acid-binding protein